jgi:hypothetical protein
VFKYAEAVFKLKELNTAAQQRGAVVQGRTPIALPATVLFYCAVYFFRLVNERNFFDHAIIFATFIKSRNQNEMEANYEKDRSKIRFTACRSQRRY